jgi:4-hydroxythreonine-4-phosphate dehydrogenase
MMFSKPLLVSSGEPAGIGPDLCLSLSEQEHPVVVLCDKAVLLARARKLGIEVTLEDYVPGKPVSCTSNHLTILPLSCPRPVVPGLLDPLNAVYVMDMLEEATSRCLSGEFSALVTAPVHKGNISQAGYDFTGHTELLAALCNVEHVVMMLVCDEMRVALVTTHLPLRHVASTITKSLLMDVITKLHVSLQMDFGIQKPRILVSGLNPHAGEGGYLGSEEIDHIIPVIQKMQNSGVNALGPIPADTMFTKDNAKDCDAFLAMYHDQGLSVLKYVGFGKAVNVTLGLPIIRTSVDHGTALELAGTGKAKATSLIEAMMVAKSMVKMREEYKKNEPNKFNCRG